MEQKSMEQLKQLLKEYAFLSGEKTVTPFGNGHINDTFLVTVSGQQDDYVLQRINGYVFPHPRQVMENMCRVTDYLRQVIRQEGGDPRREALQVIYTSNGDSCVEDENGDIWRLMLRVPDAVSPELPDTPAMLEECGVAFGRFTRRLRDFPAATLHETIQGFHDTPGRLRQLEQAVAEDPLGRLREVGEELAFARRRAEDTRLLVAAQAAGKLPTRVTHNDTKVNNTLLDSKTGRAICVADLDTVMPGLMAYDFGEGVRVGACTAPEDAEDQRGVSLDLDKYEAFARGFLPQLKGFIGEEEILSFPTGAKLMALENGMRFLADYLKGDLYFKIHRPGQNLDRARTQFALVADMERKQAQMAAILQKM